jgi:hypothetical protein
VCTMRSSFRGSPAAALLRLAVLLVAMVYPARAGAGPHEPDPLAYREATGADVDAGLTTNDQAFFKAVQYAVLYDGDIEGNGGQQAFVRFAVLGEGETITGATGPAVYVFDGDEHCGPRPVGSLFFSGDPDEAPGKVVRGVYVDHDGARWRLVDHKLQKDK